MRKTIATLLFVLGLALIITGFSVKVFPQWLTIPGGFLLLLAAAFVGVAELGSKLKGWRDLLFGEEKEKQKSSPAPKPAPQRTQEMIRSKKGEQEMHGKGGIQEQKMTDSEGGKQKME